MSKNKKTLRSLSGLVYSTDPDLKLPDDDIVEEETSAPAKQQLRIKLDTKHRAGKAVTLLQGFVGRQADMEELGKKLRSYCGTGGSQKDREIIVQGDNRDKILQWLLMNGYTGSKKV